MAKDVDEALFKRLLYLRSWMSLRVYDIIRANAMLDLQVVSRCKTYRPICAWTTITMRTARLGGFSVPNAQVPTSVLSSAPSIDFDDCEEGFAVMSKKDK
jgi:hypothetical protein